MAMTKPTTNLHLNELPFAPSAQVLQPSQDAIQHVNRYPEWDGMMLRSALAEHWGVKPEWVIVSGGGSIGVIQQTMVASGHGAIAYGWPSFEPFDMAANALGKPIIHVDLKDHACDLDALASAMTSDTSMVIVCTPNAPTGGVIKWTDLAGFLEKVSSDTIVLIDEAYGEFADAEASIDSLLFVQKYPNVMLTRTFSKAYGLAGMRVGYGIAQPELAARIMQAGLPFPVSVPFATAALGALHDQQTLQRNVREVGTERARLAARLRELGAEVVEGYGNFVWLPLGKLADKVALVLKNEGVLVKPVMPHGVRISIGTREDTDNLCRAWQTAGVTQEVLVAADES
jgi:histidinol-phosphate aminotransferase